MLEIGINTNNECGESIDEVLKNIKDNGFKNIMVAFKITNYEDLIKKAIDLGLNISYAHLVNSYADDLWVKGESNDEYIESMCEQIRVCGKYNIPIAVMHSNQGNPTTQCVPPSTHGIRSMLKILEVAKSENVKIALENVDRLNFNHFMYLLDNIDSEWLGFCYDVGHHHLYNPDFDILGKYGNRMIAIHLHDNLMDWSYGYDYTRDLHLLPFDGKVDYERVYKELKEINYSGIVMLEVHKIGLGEPRIYSEISIDKFLSEAYSRALKIAERLDK